MFSFGCSPSLDINAGVEIGSLASLLRSVLCPLVLVHILLSWSILRLYQDLPLLEFLTLAPEKPDG